MTDNSTHITLHVEGMDCANCALGITKTLQKKGMEDVNVNFATGEATFNLNEKTKLQAAIESIEALGYKVVDAKSSLTDSHLSKIEKRFYFSLIFTIPLFFSHMLFNHQFILNQPYVQLMMCFPVFIIGVMQFGKSALGSLKSGVPNMDVLIFVGSTAAFIYSLLGMFLYANSHNFMFFETTATIITLVLLGNVIEHRSVKQTTSSLKDLTAIQVAKAKMISLQLGKEVITEIDTKDIHKGALLQVNTGDKIPADGEIYSGEASIDESMITGESIPADKKQGDKVIAGTILVSGNIRMRAESIGEETVLSKIIELVKKAQNTKPEIQKLGDKISAVFVPVVLGISILTFVLSFFVFDITLKSALMSSIAVLVISCPCAMGLATPTAVMVGIGRAAKKGILIKGGSTLEEFAKVKKIVFDKTGTLTTGKFKVKAITIIGGADEQEVKTILYNLELYSSHPIAKSIVKELSNEFASNKFKNINEIKAVGIEAQDNEGNNYKIGSYKLLSSTTVDAHHAVYVFKNDALIATVDLQDELKVGAKEMIRFFNDSGIETILLSGDSKFKCDIIADELGIKTVYSQKSPIEKLEIIEQLQKNNQTSMVGDGINDAPALAKAGIGVSLGDATQVAIQTAQIVLLNKNDLSQLTEAYSISKHSLITIKQNLFWAFFYNVVAISIAAIGLLSPMIGALSMAFSDVIVIGNSIRLKTKKID
jgi:Cu+-exporting ATPase